MMAPSGPIAPWSPVLGVKLPEPSQHKWEFYNLSEDHTQNNDLSAKFPHKLKAMQKLSDVEAHPPKRPIGPPP